MRPTRPGPPVADAPGPPFYGGPDTPVCKQIKKGGAIPLHEPTPPRTEFGSTRTREEKKKNGAPSPLRHPKPPAPTARCRGNVFLSSTKGTRRYRSTAPCRGPQETRRTPTAAPGRAPRTGRRGTPLPPSDAGPQLVTFVRSPAETRPPRGQHGHVSGPRAVCPWGPNPAERPWAPGGALGVPTGHQVPESP